MLLAGVLTVAPAPDAGAPASALLAPAASPVRIPGTRLRIGQFLAETDSTGGFRTRSEAGGSITRSGDSRFFGLVARTSLWFDADRLTRARFEIDSLSPHSADYVQDGLRRLGYRSRCEVLEPSRSECEWSGGTRIVIKRENRSLSAEVTPAPPGREPNATASPGAAGSGAAAGLLIPDTLTIHQASGSYPAPDYDPSSVSNALPRYPDAARRAAVQGVVRVLALVDTTGSVIETSLVRSIPELDLAALESVRASRLRPYVFEGRLRRFRVVIPVVFALH